jgi:effector-binding domain-containing protein
MNKKVLFFVLPAVLIAACFIPVTQQKSVLIKSPFLSTYSFLANPVKWGHWVPELRKTMDADSSKIQVQKGNNSFTIKGENAEFAVKDQGTFFDITEKTNNRSSNYIYSLVPVDDKFLNKTIVSVTQKLNPLSYVIGEIWPSFNSDNHLADLKAFMETDSLLYGFNIVKTGVPDSKLVAIRKTVLQKNKFAEAAKMLATLNQYIKAKSVKQMYPVIAQFFPRGTDSTQVNVGLFIDREVPSTNEILFSRMPQGGPLVSARYKGEFSKKGEAYEALRQYFSDHVYQLAILPFDTYLDNKLPLNDHDIVNIQINFPTFPIDNPKQNEPK